MRKIAIFGGTFNPVHNAHLLIAKAAKEQIGADFVIMITNGIPPHKRNEEIVDAKIRHIMLKIVTKGIEYIIPSDYEIKQKEFSYTVNTLKFFKKLYPDDQLYFVIGTDSYKDFDKWYKPEKILELCTLLVYNRKDERNETSSFVPSEKIIKLNGDFIDISSSQIRENVDKYKEYLPNDVYNFIKEYKLYRKNDEIKTLKSMLSEKRYQHSINVADMAKKLAKKYNENEEVLFRAGLLHDIAKEIQKDEMIKMCELLEAEVDSIEKSVLPLLHAKLGAELVKCYFNIREGIITKAIRNHTVGKVGMTNAEKILFVADMCEEGRSFPGVDKIRDTAFCDLDKALVMCIDKTIEFNKNKNNQIHPVSFAIKKEYEKKL